MSLQTTDLGPRVSATTVQEYGGETRAKVDFTEARFLLRESADTADVSEPSEIAFVPDALTGTLWLRDASGNTLYGFSSTSTISL